MTERRLTFSFIGQSAKSLKYFSHFFFTPAIATFTDNIVGYQKKWAYRRIICLYIFWWEFAIEWKYGEQAKLFS